MIQFSVVEFMLSRNTNHKLFQKFKELKGHPFFSLKFESCHFFKKVSVFFWLLAFITLFQSSISYVLVIATDLCIFFVHKSADKLIKRFVAYLVRIYIFLLRETFGSFNFDFSCSLQNHLLNLKNLIDG